MAKLDFLTAKLYKAKPLPADFFDMMSGPPVGAFFSPQEVAEVKHLITHNNNEVKMHMLNAIMKSKGFNRLSAGTNRVVYRYLDDPSFVLKVAFDRVGLNDNVAEFKNQNYLKPYVCKIFDTTPCGTMATIERVLPITSKEEFQSHAATILYIIAYKILGVNIAEDIGKNYFRNWGIRANFGPVLLDYPYIYRLDGDKLFCTAFDQGTGIKCDGVIDYDYGFNHLYCNVCGRRYLAVDLEDKNPTNYLLLERGGKYPMKVSVTKSDGSVVEPIRSSTFMTRTLSEEANKRPVIKVSVVRQPVIEKKKYDGVELLIDENKEAEVLSTTEVSVDLRRGISIIENTNEEEAVEETSEEEVISTEESSEETDEESSEETDEESNEETDEESNEETDEESTEEVEGAVSNENKETSEEVKKEESVTTILASDKIEVIESAEVKEPAKTPSKKASSGTKKSSSSKKASSSKVKSNFIPSPGAVDDKG